MDQSARSPSTSAPSISVCTIGDLILDVIVLPRDALAHDGDTPATIRLAAGGQAANVAAWVGALGASSRLICKRGDDAATELAASELARHGVRICGPVDRGAGGVVVSVREPDGSRTMASDRGVAPLLSVSELESEWFEDCDVLHVSGYCLFAEHAAAAAARAAQFVEKVTVDLASEHGIAAVDPRAYSERLSALRPSLIFATEAERRAVSDLDPYLRDLEAEWVVKRGALGAEFPEGSFPADAADLVDATGAGDALAAGYLVGGPALALEAAARCVSQIGAMPAI
jgi:sugar/nucleoside kinase (ribokinase family)